MMMGIRKKILRRSVNGEWEMGNVFVEIVNRPGVLYFWEKWDFSDEVSKV